MRKLDATLLTPVAVAAETGMPLATTSTEIAEIAEIALRYTRSVVLL